MSIKRTARDTRSTIRSLSGSTISYGMVDKQYRINALNIIDLIVIQSDLLNHPVQKKHI